MAAPMTPLEARYDLARLPLVRALLRSRWPQFVAQAGTLAGFIFTILVGLFGSPVGGANFAIIFVWIAWWSALKLIFIPLGGRAWCSVCPLPMPGEWLPRGALLGPTGKRLGLRWRWPQRLRGTWLQAGAFVAIGLFSAVTLTQPRVTGWVLLTLILLALITGLVFERRAFCRYLCPIGGFTGLYANLAPVEVRVKDRTVCAQHTEKDCYQGCAKGYGCPWNVYPPTLQENAYCGLCFECLRACPKENIAVNLRPLGSDVGRRPAIRLDEAAFALVMLSTALTYAVVFLGSWGEVKMAAYSLGSPAWLLYALVFLAMTVFVVPGLFMLAVHAGQVFSGSTQPIRKAAATLAQVLVPLGLGLWVAFTLAFGLIKLPYVLTVISDPLAQGWNLLGTAHLTAFPDLSGLSTVLEVIVLGVGLFWSARVARQVTAFNAGAKSPLRQAWPVMGFCLVVTLTMLWLLAG
jgi:hypothetical protein